MQEAQEDTIFSKPLITDRQSSFLFRNSLLEIKKSQTPAKILRKKGLTVVEILVFAVLASMLLAVLWNLFVYARTSTLRGKKDTELLRALRLITAYLKNDLENATSLVTDNKDEFIITRILDFDRNGCPGFRDVKYSNEDGIILRQEEGVAPVLFGTKGRLELSFRVTKKLLEDEVFDRYEVKIELAGRHPSQNESDEISLIVCPVMMSRNKLRNWIPIPSN